MSIQERVELLRDWLSQSAFSAFIIPHEDEFLGEYIPVHNDRLHWATGFTGSAGIAIVSQHDAAIFVDGRYTVQVKKQVPSPPFGYFHLIDQPINQWIKNNLTSKSRIAIDPKLHSIASIERLTNQLGNQFELVFIEQNPIDKLWLDRPAALLSPARLMPLNLTGKSAEDKRQQIAKTLCDVQIDVAVITQLDNICWLLNIRGSDVPRLPVLLTTALITSTGELTLFIDEQRLPNDFYSHAGKGVSILAPELLAQTLRSFAGKTVSIDKTSCNSWIHQQLNENNTNILFADDPCSLIKAAKNPTELGGMQACHIRDAVAVSEFLAWLDEQVAQGLLHDEAVLSDKLHSFRQQDQALVDLSFDTISAAAGNAAMCHYRHTDQPAPAKLELNNVYLVDSGGQYLDGTTDITRTIAIGECRDEIKRAFTLVLKGHIALATARFPKGTTGSQLDSLARQFLWADNKDYDHGTGHGVGHALNVHEGPQRISKAPNPIALEVGMVLSNEPGFYQADDFGIRIENLEQVIGLDNSGVQPTLGFSPLTCVPIDYRLVDVSLLSESEKLWWNNYHQRVWDTLSPLISQQALSWLKQATRPL